MDLLSNQTYKKKVVFREIDNEDRKVAISLTVQCNHELPMNILQSIEGHLNSLLIHDYMTEELYLKHKELDKKEAKLKKESEKLQKKLEDDFKKRNDELRERETKAALEFEKIQNSKVKKEVEKIETKETKSKRKKDEPKEEEYIMPKI